MSVDLVSWMAEDGLDPLHYVANPDHGAVMLSVKTLRENGYIVGWDPDGGHEHHGSVWDSFTGKARRRIKKLVMECLRRAKGEAEVVSLDQFRNPQT